MVVIIGDKNMVFHFFFLKAFTGYPCGFSALYPLQKQLGSPRERSRIKRLPAKILQIKNRRNLPSRKAYQAGFNSQQRRCYGNVMICLTRKKRGKVIGNPVNLNSGFLKNGNIARRVMVGSWLFHNLWDVFIYFMGRSGLLIYWDGEVKRTALPFRTFRPDPAPVRLDQVAGDG